MQKDVQGANPLTDTVAGLNVFRLQRYIYNNKCHPQKSEMTDSNS